MSAARVLLVAVLLAIVAGCLLYQPGGVQHCIAILGHLGQPSGVRCIATLP